MPTANAWRCIVCGYVHHGGEPPAECPVCGASREDFEPAVLAPSDLVGTAPAPAAPGGGAGAPRRLVIVGAGIAGVAAAEAAREIAPDAEITLVNGEADAPYYRINLTRLIAGEIAESDLPLHPPAWFEERRIRRLDGCRAVGLDAAARRVALDNGSALEADRVVLATGAAAFVPPIEGADKKGVFTIRSRPDAAAVLAAAPPGASVVFIGGGILSLEAAAGLRRRGAAVTILEVAPRLMARQLNERGGRVLERHAAAAGMKVVTNARVRAIEGWRRAKSVALEDGARHAADAVVIGAGVRPDVALARGAGLKIARGIVVDDRLATSAEGIYAAGDVAEHRGALYGTWDPARYQGQIAAWNAMGRPAEFGGLPPANTLKVMGVKLFSVGEVGGGAGVRTIESETDDRYFGFFFRGTSLAGAILLGDTHAALGARRAVESRADLGALLAKNPDAEAVAAALAADA